jgi:hypothetical protein
LREKTAISAFQAARMGWRPGYKSIKGLAVDSDRASLSISEQPSMAGRWSFMLMRRHYLWNTFMLSTHYAYLGVSISS